VKIPVVTNRAAGAKDDSPLLVEAFRKAGCEIEIVACSGEEVVAAARRGAEGPSPLVVAAGGDGTISAVAGALAGSDKVLGVVPSGTLNHFARDMGIPLEMAEAARVAVEGRTVRIDVAEVNGRAFINNSSLGFYSSLVRDREVIRSRDGRGKWSALFRAGVNLLRRAPTVAVRVMTAEGEIARRTPLLFVGNNRYDVSGWSLGKRARLDGGELFVCVLPVRSGARLVALGLRALLFPRGVSRQLLELAVSECWVDLPDSASLVSADGELHRLRPPLHYRLRPRALSVRVPRRA